jgi:hypothetical protein
VNSALSALPTFYRCSLKIPPQIIKQIDVYRKHCWNNGEIHRKETCRYLQNRGTHKPTIKKNKMIKPQQNTAHLDQVQGPSHTRTARRDVSTAPQLRLVRGTPDGNDSTAPRLIQGPYNKAPRLRSDPHEARSATGKSLTCTTSGRYA